MMLKRQTAPFGGVVLLPSDSIKGELLFSWEMVDATLVLFHFAAQLRAPNGCTPRFVHLIGEQEAPIEHCQRVHAELSRTPGVSRLHYTTAMDVQSNGFVQMSQ